MYDVPNLPNIKIGDILYVRITKLENSSVFGSMAKGDILYVEKGKY